MPGSGRRRPRNPPTRAALPAGAPARDREGSNTRGYAGIFGLIVLALDIWAIVSVVNSDASTGAKVIWVLVILVLPILGFLAWLLLGPRAAARGL